jgi:CRP/FNR family transcriptional regulator, cyclic AMP receptor protein
MDSGTIENFAPGKAIFFEGEKAECMYILQEGVVELRKQTEKGEVVLKTVTNPNEFFGEMALIDGKERSTSAIAVRPSSLIVIDKTRFEHLLQTNGAFAVKIVRALTERIRSTNRHLTEVVDTSPRERIVRGIVDYALHFGDKGSGDARYIIKEDAKEWLNAHIGVSREEVEGVIYRLKEMKRVAESTEGPQKAAFLVVTGDFIREYDRRSGDRAPGACP